MLEKEIERRLVKRTKAVGGVCLKFTSPSLMGIPDRIVLLPRGKIGFVEVKRPGEKPRPLQQKRMKQLSDLGFPVFVLDDEKKIAIVLQAIGGDAE